MEPTITDPLVQCSFTVYGHKGKQNTNRGKEVNEPGFLPVGGEVLWSQSGHVSLNTVPGKSHNVVEHVFT